MWQTHPEPWTTTVTTIKAFTPVAHLALPRINAIAAAVIVLDLVLVPAASHLDVGINKRYVHQARVPRNASPTPQLTLATVMLPRARKVPRQTKMKTTETMACRHWNPAHFGFGIDSGVGSPSSSEEAYCPGFGVDVFGYGGEEGGGRREEEEEEEDTAGSGNGYDEAATPQNCKTWTSRPRRTTSRRKAAAMMRREEEEEEWGRKMQTGLTMSSACVDYGATNSCVVEKKVWKFFWGG